MITQSDGHCGVTVVTQVTAQAQAQHGTSIIQLSAKKYCPICSHIWCSHKLPFPFSFSVFFSDVRLVLLFLCNFLRCVLGCFFDLGFVVFAGCGLKSTEKD